MSKPRSLCQAVLVSMSLFMLANNTFAKPTSTNQNMASTTPSDASLIQLAKLSNFEKEFQNGVKQGFLSSVSASVMQDKAFQKLTPEQQNRVQKILEDFSEKILAGINTPELSQQALDGYVKTAKKYFLDKLAENKYKDQSIKALLLEGNVFCGCGNIYDCEVLYRQKIHPLTKASELSKKKKESLFKELVDILDLAIREGGSTISDYIHADGGEGNMQNFHQIYGKKVCPLGHDVENVTIKGRSSHFCPICQKIK